MNPKTIGDRIQLLMLNKKISTQELAQILGVDRKTIWSWKAGSTEPLSSQIRILAIVFGVTCDYLINGK
ncbi:MAG: helix-turn-helix transcriptional regulator [Methanobrevibacter sp.]|nr:helix-turn-helix transcriptional regulator [Methanobrevibacter sp.]